MSFIDDSFAPNRQDGESKQFPVRRQELTAAGAITIASGTVVLNDGSAVAATLAKPPLGMDGATLRIMGIGGGAHTVTYSADGFNSAGSTSSVATFSAEAGTVLELTAEAGVWYVFNWQDTATSITFAAPA